MNELHFVFAVILPPAYGFAFVLSLFYNYVDNTSLQLLNPILCMFSNYWKDFHDSFFLWSKNLYTWL